MWLGLITPPPNRPKVSSLKCRRSPPSLLEISDVKEDPKCPAEKHLFYLAKPITSTTAVTTGRLRFTSGREKTVELTTLTEEILIGEGLTTPLVPLRNLTDCAT